MDKLRLLIVHPNTCWLVSRLFKQLVLPAARWLCIKYRSVLPLAWYCFSFTLIWLIIINTNVASGHIFHISFHKLFRNHKLFIYSCMADWAHKICLQTPGAPNGNFRENICSEDDLRSRIFGAFVVKFLACLPRIFEHLQNSIITHF